MSVQQIISMTEFDEDGKVVLIREQIIPEHDNAINSIRRFSKYISYHNNSHDFVIAVRWKNCNER